MKDRPYFNKSTADLEKIFQRNPNDRNTLDLLLHELGFRNRPRAHALQARVLAATKETSRAADKTNENPSPDPNGGPPEPSQPQERTPVAQAPARPVSKPGPKPPVTNAAQDILRTWTALEVLSPQGYRRETDLAPGDKSRIARFDESDLPWELGERSRPKKRLYYELILGAVALAPAVEALLKLYADNRPDKPSMKGFCPIANILLDKEGRPLEEESSFAISSFAWGVPIALQGDLKKLADWPAQERSLMSSFRQRLIRRDRNNEVLPLTKKHIKE
ncbi:MAG: hypothetical protein Kow00114_29530 [Kiloniellaceae bacterium]